MGKGPALRALSTSPCHHYAAAGDFILYYWFGDITVASVKETRAILRSTAAQHPAGVRVLALIESGLSIPGQDVRDTSAMLDRELAGLIRAHATVIPGHGFWVATSRSVLSTVFFLSRSAYPKKVFGMPGEALAWLDTLGQVLPREALLGYVADLRKAAPQLAAQAGS
jgi:hypothetical protein